MSLCSCPRCLGLSVGPCLHANQLPVPAVPTLQTAQSMIPGLTQYQYDVLLRAGMYTVNEVREMVQAGMAALNPLEPPPVEKPDFVGPRGTYKVEKLGWDWKNDPDIEKGYYEPAEYADANLVGSKVDLEEDGHLPVIDLDLPVHLEESTTPGHYHLYVNKVVAWDKFLKVLEAMHEAGLVQEGFYEMTKRRGQAYVRRPGVFKKPGEGSSE